MANGIQNASIRTSPRYPPREWRVPRQLQPGTQTLVARPPLTEQAERFHQHAKLADLPLTILMRENDLNFLPALEEVLCQADLMVTPMQPREPILRAYVEQLIQAIRMDRCPAAFASRRDSFDHAWHSEEASRPSTP